MRTPDRAYIAGIFDGEGCVHFRDNGKRRPMLTISQKNPEVLLWIQQRVGCGNLYQYSSTRGWVLNFGSKADVLTLISHIYKYSIVKRKALSAARRNLEQ